MTALQAEIALGIVVQLIACVYVYGKLTQKVSGHGEAIVELKRVDNEQWAKLNEHGDKLGDHGERISFVEAKLNIKKG